MLRARPVVLLHQLGRIEYAEFFALIEARVGNFDPLFEYIRARLSPHIAQEIVDLIEGRLHRPAHRIRSAKISQRNVSIASFIHRRLAEGMSLPAAKGLAAKKFRKSKSTVRDVCKAYRALIFAKPMPEKTGVTEK